MKKRKRIYDRSRDVTCNCRAYKYPHRQFGGRCTLHRWVRAFYGATRDQCIDCHHNEGNECECVIGIEAPHHCPELRGHIRYQGITLYGAAREAAKRSTKGESEHARRSGAR